eukprot:6806395-Pyramimonas_sp.AAC.1
MQACRLLGRLGSIMGGPLNVLFSSSWRYQAIRVVDVNAAPSERQGQLRFRQIYPFGVPAFV